MHRLHRLGERDGPAPTSSETVTDTHGTPSLLSGDVGAGFRSGWGRQVPSDYPEDYGTLRVPESTPFDSVSQDH